MFQSVVCQKTGKTAKLYMEKYCEMSGSYKPVSYSGVKEVLAVMGNEFSLQISFMISTNGYKLLENILKININSLFYSLSTKLKEHHQDLRTR